MRSALCRACIGRYASTGNIVTAIRTVIADQSNRKRRSRPGWIERRGLRRGHLLGGRTGVAASRSLCRRAVGLRVIPMRSSGRMNPEPKPSHETRSVGGMLHCNRPVGARRWNTLVAMSITGPRIGGKLTDRRCRFAVSRCQTDAGRVERGSCFVVVKAKWCSIVSNANAKTFR